ncbi:hypothetical protein BN85316400 [Paracholeplasma brassicae]|uniref:Uncharacterized protein n=1 Tax=Acholeplasma brassicae TaxID=61635 RepID=U4KQD7_9MOLU|nr:hypothetical protein [Paracholeplasma brassicae]CCV66661.1 hypothetical protein BN85316400 [Paracholeplasma brassicae]
MIEIALLELNERDLLFRETAQESRLSEAIIEKDYGGMKHMFFDEIPSFKQIINFLKETESIYNEKIRLNKNK